MLNISWVNVTSDEVLEGSLKGYLFKQEMDWGDPCSVVVNLAAP